MYFYYFLVLQVYDLYLFTLTCGQHDFNMILVSFCRNMTGATSRTNSSPFRSTRVHLPLKQVRGALMSIIICLSVHFALSVLKIMVYNFPFDMFKLYFICHLDNNINTPSGRDKYRYIIITGVSYFLIITVHVVYHFLC